MVHLLGEKCCRVENRNKDEWCNICRMTAGETGIEYAHLSAHNIYAWQMFHATGERSFRIFEQDQSEILNSARSKPNWKFMRNYQKQENTFKYWGWLLMKSGQNKFDNRNNSQSDPQDLSSNQMQSSYKILTHWTILCRMNIQYCSRVFVSKMQSVSFKVLVIVLFLALKTVKLQGVLKFLLYKCMSFLLTCTFLSQQCLTLYNP